MVGSAKVEIANPWLLIRSMNPDSKFCHNTARGLCEIGFLAAVCAALMMIVANGMFSAMPVGKRGLLLAWTFGAIVIPPLGLQLYRKHSVWWSWVMSCALSATPVLTWCFWDAALGAYPGFVSG